MKHPSSPYPCRQHGAATLVVVMVLFFILAMMAAFANRNVIFEQRVASNYFRSGLAFEAAEAGAEWALARLNGGDVDGACSASPGSGSFARRYLSIDADTGTISRNGNVVGSTSGCVRGVEEGLVCTCPGSVSGGLTPPAVAASPDFQPMFGVDFASVPRAGLVRMQISGCTGALRGCTNLFQASGQDLGFSSLNVHLALISALKSPPTSPLTVQRDATLDGAGLGLHNTQSAQGGLVLQAGGLIQLNGTPQHIETVPGTPLQHVIVQDTLLTRASDRPLGMFGMFFGMSPSRYRDQPSVRTIACAAGADCSEQIADAVNAGARQIWVPGNLVLASNLTLGSSAAPVVLIADGTVSLQGPMNLTGVIYARGNASWTSLGAMPAQLTGALLSEGNWSSSGRVDLVYSSAVLQALNKQTGSFVRVLGSWKE